MEPPRATNAPEALFLSGAWHNTDIRSVEGDRVVAELTTRCGFAEFHNRFSQFLYTERGWTPQGVGVYTPGAPVQRCPLPQAPMRLLPT